MHPSSLIRILSLVLALGSVSASKSFAQAGIEEAKRFEGLHLTPEQAARFSKYLPKTLARFQQRLPVHVVVLGDSIANMLGHGDDSYDWLRSFHGIFVRELCRTFYYPGGVRLIKGRSGKPAKLDASIGPEVTLRNMARNGSTSLHIFQRLTTDAFYNRPNLIIINFGINDALAGVALHTYKEAVTRAVDFAQSRGAEVVLLGPAIIIADSPEIRAMSITRPYSSVMREIAAEKGCFFADLGDISGLVGGTPPRTPVDQVEKNIVGSMKEYFNHGPEIVDYIHPNATGHRMIGKHAFRNLLRPKENDYAITSSTAELEGDDLTLTLKLENRADEERLITLVPMPLAKTYATVDPPREVKLEAKGSVEIVLNYKSQANPKTPTGFRYDLLPGFEEFVRGSILCSDEQATIFADFKAQILPVAFNWKMGGKFNLTGKFPVGGELVNAGSEPLTANVTAEWGGQKGSGRAIVPPGGRHSLTFEFQFPQDPSVFRQGSEIVLTVEAGGKVHRFRRGIEVSRNIGLGQSVVLTDVMPRMAGEEPDRNKSARFRAEADSKALYLIYEMRGINIAASPQAPNGITADIAIDARSYGKRQEFGFIDEWRIVTGAVDGPGRCGKLWLGVFGNGYALEMEKENISSSLQTLPGGIRRLTVVVPRNYLYLHEFALGNGNSQLGIDTTLSIQEREGTAPPAMTNRLSLVASGMHRNNAQALTVLELTKPATQRWSLRVY